MKRVWNVFELQRAHHFRVRYLELKKKKLILISCTKLTFHPFYYVKSINLICNILKINVKKNATADGKQKYKHYTAERMTSSISRKIQLDKFDYFS